MGAKERGLGTAARAEVVARADAGESERSIAARFDISRSQVWDIKQAAKKAAAAVQS